MLFGVLIAIPLLLFVGIVVAFLVAGILDFIQHRRDSRDLFKLLARDYTVVKRRARK